MLDIEYHGGNSIWLSTKSATLAIDANVASIGLKQPSLPKSCVQVATEKRFLVLDEESLKFEGPGEYETGPFSIVGVAAQRHIDTEFEPKLDTIYRIEVGGVNLAVIGNIAPDLDDDQMETIGVVDILIIPVGGGGYTLDAVQATKIIRNIEPKVVIPVHYAGTGINYEVPQEGLDTFVKEIGAPVEETAKYKIKSISSIPQALTIVAITKS